MPTRCVTGAAAVVREIRAAASLLAEQDTPVPARGPWLTAAVHARRGPLSGTRPCAVVVGPGAGAAPDALALLTVRRAGPVAAVLMLGQDLPARPDGRPGARLPARTDADSAALAEGVLALLDRLGRRWTLELSGLNLGDPTVRRLAAALPTAHLATARSRALVDELDSVGRVHRSTSPAELERRLPVILARLPGARTRTTVRALARLHAAIGQLELAVLADAPRPAQGLLLTLVDGADRWPWWGVSDLGGLRLQTGSPVVTLSARSEGVEVGGR